MASMKESLRRMDHRDIGSSGFWVGHMLMIMATIIGVFLAAQAGLAQAIKFDQYKDLQSNYFLRQSLLEEVTDNVKILREYEKEYLSQSVANITLKTNRPDLSTYVWESMKFNSATLETPSFYLTSIRRFYSTSMSLIDKAEQQQLSAVFAAKQLKSELDYIESEVIQSLQVNCNKLAEDLMKYGIDVKDSN
jgi:hypothetical protein